MESFQFLRVFVISFVVSFLVSILTGLIALFGIQNQTSLAKEILSFHHYRITKIVPKFLNFSSFIELIVVWQLNVSNVRVIGFTIKCNHSF